MDDDDYDLEYESYASSESENEFELENLYYNAKSRKEDSLQEAIEEFENLIEIENSTENVDDYTWGFKSYKQICKSWFGSKNYEEFLKNYKKLLEIYGKKSKRSMQKKYFEDSINKIIKYVGNKNNNLDPKIQLKFHSITLENLNLKPTDKLWFGSQIKIGLLHFQNDIADNKNDDYNKVTEVIKSFYDHGENLNDKNDIISLNSTASKSDDTASDTNVQDQIQNEQNEHENHISTIKNKEKFIIKTNFNPTQILQIISLEIQLYTKLNNYQKLSEINDKSKNLVSDFCNVFDQGIVKELSAKINLKKLKYSQAKTDFFEAFKNFEECGNYKKYICLKFYCLTAMLMNDHIHPFDSPETNSFKNHKELKNILRLYDAYSVMNTKKFDKILCEDGGTQFIQEDKMLFHFFKRLQIELWYKSLLEYLMFIAASTTDLHILEIPIPDISNHLEISERKAHLLVIFGITERGLEAKFDQENNCLVLDESMEDIGLRNSRNLGRMAELTHFANDMILNNSKINV